MWCSPDITHYAHPGAGVKGELAFRQKLCMMVGVMSATTARLVRRVRGKQTLKSFCENELGGEVSVSTLSRIERGMKPSKGAQWAFYNHLGLPFGDWKT